MVSSILLLGSGAIGSFYASFLKQQGCSITVVSRSPELFTVKDIHYASGDVCMFKPDKVMAYEELCTCLDVFDIVLVCTKVLNYQKLIECILTYPHIKAMPIVLIQNGYGIERQWLDMCSNLNIWRALAFICVYQEGNSKVIHQDFGDLVLGPVNSNSVRKTIDSVVNLWKKAGLKISVSNKIAEDIWKKQCWNIPFNGLSVIKGYKTTEELLVSYEAEIRELMFEVIQLAQVDGIPLDRDLIDTLIDRTYRMQAYYTSMCLDAKAKRALEFDAIYGNSLALAKQKKLELPRIKQLALGLKEFQCDLY